MIIGINISDAYSNHFINSNLSLNISTDEGYIFKGFKGSAFAFH